MSTPEELAKYIEFHLDRLGERNQHHEFEHVCRRVAAARIASNILPATGPVSGGGDQGRDFETHPTAIGQEVRFAPPGSWSALAAQERIAFCATTQRSKLRSKIEADVDSIMADGERPDRVHAFTAGAMTKAERAKAIRAVREKHDLELVVHDVVYLAEQLAQPDLFWVAKRYLDVPDELAPRQEDETDNGAPAWYLADRERWRSREPFPTMGDLLDLTDGLRRATWHTHARPDLGFWLGLIRPLAADVNPRDVRQRARYEIAVAVLRGQGSLFPADDLVRAYAGDLRDDEPPEHYSQASALLQYARTAVMYGQSSLEFSMLNAWEAELTRILAARIATEDGPNRLAELLYTDGFIKVQPTLEEAHASAQPREIPDTSRWVDRDLMVAEAQERALSPELLKDFEGGMATWLRLARMLDQAPLFDVDGFATVLSVLTPALVDHPDWRELTDRVEEVLGRQAGQAVVAARCRDRAIMLRERSRHREAIHELHRAKADWWSGTTLRGSLLSLLMIAESYKALGLDHAAAQCVLTVAYVANNHVEQDHRDLIAPALSIAADLEHRWGAWVGAAELAETAILTASHYREGGVDPDMFESTLIHAGTIEAAASVFLDDAPAQALVEALEGVGVSDLLGGDPRAAWRESGKLVTPQEWDAAARDQLLGPPFQDVSNDFVLRFSVFGQAWSIRAAVPGDRACRRACERFAAAAQIMLLELSGDELCLLATPVDIEIAVRDMPGSLETWTRPAEGGRAWRFALSPADAEINDQMTELLESVTKVILDTSLLPGEEFVSAFRSAAERGLQGKLFSGQPYDELRHPFRDDRLWAALAGVRRPDPPPDWLPTEKSALEWPSGPGPTYTEALGQEGARNRYETIIAKFPRQLAALRRDPPFQATLAELRRRGWPDHLVLLGIFNITLNHRAAVAGLDPRREVDHARMVELQKRPETKGSPLAPLAKFTVQAMEDARRLSMVSTLVNWDLMLHVPTPNLDAVEAFLATRYRYWIDDIEHEDPFAT